MGRLIIPGKRIILKELTEPDLPTLLYWRNSDIFQKTCLSFIKECSLDELSAEIMKAHQCDRYAHFIAWTRGNDTPVGTTWVYRYNQENAIAYVTTFIAEEKRGAYYWGIEMFILCCNFVFEGLGCRKIYLEVHGNNTTSLEIFRKLNLSEEARLINHTKISENEYTELLIYAVNKKEFLNNKLVQRFK